MNITQRVGILQRWRVVQHELIPELKQEIGPLTPRLEKLIHTLEWVRIEEFVESAWNGKGRPPHDRGALANAFVAKALLGLGTTGALIERLQIDRALKRICGFPMWKRLPDESSFSRAFAEFARAKLAERVHEALVKAHLGAELIGHISRDGTAIEAREQPLKKAPAAAEPKPGKAKRGRPAKGEEREARRRASDGNCDNPWRKCSPNCPRVATEAQRATPRATRTAGTATSCTSTRPTVAYRSAPCSPAPRCTTARR